jgi:hypothetical protein
VSTAVLFEVHMQDRTGGNLSVDTHLIGDSIEQVVGYPDGKDILNQNGHDQYSLVVVLHIVTERGLGHRERDAGRGCSGARPTGDPARVASR